MLKGLICHPRTFSYRLDFVRPRRNPEATRRLLRFASCLTFIRGQEPSCAITEATKYSDSLQYLIIPPNYSVCACGTRLYVVPTASLVSNSVLSKTGQLQPRAKSVSGLRTARVLISILPLLTRRTVLADIISHVHCAGSAKTAYDILKGRY